VTETSEIRVITWSAAYFVGTWRRHIFENYHKRNWNQRNETIAAVSKSTRNL